MEEQQGPTKESLISQAETFDAKSGFGDFAKSEPSGEAQKEPDTLEAVEADAKAETAEKPDASAKSESDGSDSSSLKESQSESSAKPQSKWAANEDRKNRSWKEVNAEKEALKSERDALKQEQSRLSSERETFQKAQNSADSSYRDEKGHSVKDYREAEAKFREEGDSELAQMAGERAGKLEHQEVEARQQQAAQVFNQKWLENYTKLAEKDPDLKNEQSDTYKAIVDLINRYPLLKQTPDGLNYAHEAVTIGKKGREMESFKAENVKLKGEVDKYKKKLAIGGGLPTEPLEGEKPFERMSRDEQRKRLMSNSEDFDRMLR